MLKVVIRAVEVPVSLSLRVAGIGVTVAGRVAGWALTGVQRGLAPERPGGGAVAPEVVNGVPSRERAPETRVQHAGDVSGTTALEPEGQPAPVAPAGKDLGTPIRDEPPPRTHEPPSQRARSPHSPLNNPLTEPDLTEWPDPYDHREDPRDPGEDMVFGEAAGHTYTGSTSTSEPHPSQDPEAEPWEGPKRDKVDE